MKLTTAQNISNNNATQKDIDEAFSDDYGRGEFIILSKDKQIYIQAAGENDGPYVLEYREGSKDQHFQTSKSDLSKEQIKAAFTKYLSGDNSWKSDFKWQQIPQKIGFFRIVSPLEKIVMLVFLAIIGSWMYSFSQVNDRLAETETNLSESLIEEISLQEIFCSSDPTPIRISSDCPLDNLIEHQNEYTHTQQINSSEKYANIRTNWEMFVRKTDNNNRQTSNQSRFLHKYS